VMRRAITLPRSVVTLAPEKLLFLNAPRKRFVVTLTDKSLEISTNASIQNGPRRLKQIKVLHWQTLPRGSFDHQRLLGALPNLAEVSARQWQAARNGNKRRLAAMIYPGEGKKGQPKAGDYLLAAERLHGRREKNGSPSVHPITRCATPSWPPIGSRTSGGSRNLARGRSRSVLQIPCRGRSWRPASCRRDCRRHRPRDGRAASSPVQNDSGLPQGPAGASGAP